MRMTGECLATTLHLYSSSHLQFLFIFLRNAKIKSNIIERIGRCSFGIYLTHYMIMKCMFMVIPKFSSLLEKYVMSMIMALVALLLSMIASGLLARLRLSYLVR
jgi:peptidoglycan/LPS O-acetylase OafA/YrhL